MLGTLPHQLYSPTKIELIKIMVLFLEESPSVREKYTPIQGVCQYTD